MNSPCFPQRIFWEKKLPRLGGLRAYADHNAQFIGIEVHGYMKLNEKRDGRARGTPKRGSTAKRLQAIYDLIERHLS